MKLPRGITLVMDVLLSNNLHRTRLFLVISVIFACTIFVVNESKAATQSAHLDASVSGQWNHPNDATDVTDGSCSNGKSDDNVQHTWKWDACTFGIPSGSTINGLEVVIRYGSRTDGLDIELSPDNSSWGTAKTFVDPLGGAQGCASSDSLSEGSSGDLWGNTWTLANINDDVYIRLTARPDGDQKKFYVDSIELTIYYTPGVIKRNWQQSY